MTGPVRIQLRRTRGWRMPAGAIRLDRATKWGNPFSIFGSHARKAFLEVRERSRR